MESVLYFAANNNEKPPEAHSLARKFSQELTASILERFELPEGDIALLLDDAAGAYLSEKEPDMLCCLAVSAGNGHMYLVTAKILDGGARLGEIKSDPIS